MIFRETPIPGAFEIEVETITDERGWFGRTFDAAEFARRGIELEVLQANSSFNQSVGTLRGMHYQREPHGEPKLVRCSRGAIFDVIVDLRPDSPELHTWHGVTLTEDSETMLYVPRGVAHGFQTLAGGSRVDYLMGAEYAPGSAAGVRWDDPAFGIDWPEPEGERIISEADAAHPLVGS